VAWRLLAAAVVAAATVGAAEPKLPPPPAAYFNDEAGLVPASEARRLDDKLRAFADETSTQIVVAVFKRLPSPSLEDFTLRTAESWRVGTKKYDNGAILFVFPNERKLRIEVGYGLEGALPDALARRIIAERITPRFRSGDFAGGLEAGIDGIIAATRGEYRAPPRDEGAGSVALLSLVLFAALVLLVLWLAARANQAAVLGRTYNRRGWDRSGWWGGGWSGGSFGGGGGSWGGGGSSGGGGFSGGGGSFGGGGASGSW
jgi:uncharacterized protein